jgi:predicted nucleotidyltransferase
MIPEHLGTTDIDILLIAQIAPDADLRAVERALVRIDLRRLRARREEILGSAAERGARNVRVFGSVVRGESDASSDVDLLVEMEPGRSLIDLVGLRQDLEDVLAPTSMCSATAA